MKVRITSLALALVLLLTSTTGCSLSKKSNNGNIKETITTSDTKNDTELSLQDRMIAFIELIQNSDVDIDLTNFYQKARTLQIIYEKTGDQYYNSYYDMDQNVIFINIDSPGAFEHELLHVIFNNGLDLGNVFIEEGITELLSSELTNSQNTYRYNVGVIKILSTILGRDKVMECINKKDLSILTEGLAGIKPEVKDAEEVMQYLDYEHKLNQKMHQAFYNEGNLDKFKETEEYVALKNVRNDLTTRLKIYTKNYFINKVREDGINPEEVLIEMLSLLDVFEVELFDPDVEIERANDFFLRDEVSYLMNKYGISEDTYNNCYELSKTRTYLVGSSGTSISKSK